MDSSFGSMLLVTHLNSKYTFLSVYSTFTAYNIVLLAVPGIPIYIIYIIRVSYNDNTAVLKNGFRKQLGLLNINIYIYVFRNYFTILYFFVRRGLAKKYTIRLRGQVFVLAAIFSYYGVKKKLAAVYIARCGNIAVSQK